MTLDVEWCTDNIPCATLGSWLAVGGFTLPMRPLKRPTSVLLLLVYSLVGGLGASSPIVLCKDSDGTSRIETVVTRCCEEQCRPTTVSTDDSEHLGDTHGSTVSANDTCIDTPTAGVSDHQAPRASSASSDSHADCFILVALPLPVGADIAPSRLHAAQSRVQDLPATAARIALRSIVLVC